MAALLLLVALIAPGIAQYCPPSVSGQSYNDFILKVYCGHSPSCICEKRPNVSGTGICSRYQLTCPFISIISSSAYVLDSTCHTYFSINDTRGNYLAQFSAIYKNGSIVDGPLSYMVDIGSDNVWTYSSPYCTFIQKVISVNQLIIGIRQIISDECSDIVYPVVVGYPCPQYGSASDLPLIRRVLSDYGVGCPDIIVLPRRYPFNCATLQSTNTGSTVNCPGKCRRSGDPNY